LECIRLEQEDLTSLTDKELIKKIKGDSDNFKDWYYNEDNAKYYQEIERRNRLVKYPQGNYGKIFRDDPQAIQKMQDKIKVLEDRKDYWKKIIKFPARTYHEIRGALGDQKWYAAAGASTDLNMAKKKLVLIENQGILTRKPTYVKDQEGTSKRRFYYTEESKE
jgi:hypothetical protein